MSEALVDELIRDLHYGLETAPLGLVPRPPTEQRACPTCHKLMDSAMLEDIPVERCGGGDGLWLDAGELGQVLYRAALRPPRTDAGALGPGLFPAALRPPRGAPTADPTADNLAWVDRVLTASAEAPGEDAAAGASGVIRLDDDAFSIDAAALTVYAATRDRAVFDLVLHHDHRSITLRGSLTPAPVMPIDLARAIVSLGRPQLDALATALRGQPSQVQPVGWGKTLTFAAAPSPTGVRLRVAFQFDWATDPVTAPKFGQRRARLDLDAHVAALSSAPAPAPRR
jgi:hypothetical protein